MSKILGIFGGSHNASASYVKDGEIICCLEEERLVKIKSGNDFGRLPELAVKKILDEYSLHINEFDHIAVCAPICNSFLQDLGIDNDKVVLVNHHTSHAYGAYLTSGFEDKTIVFSYDGGGDKEYGKIYLAENNELTLIKDLPLWNTASAGQIYGHATKCLGWEMLKDEGKVTGLAAHGKYDEKIYNLLSELFKYNGDLSFSPPDSPGKTGYLLNSLKNIDYFKSEVDYKYTIAYNIQTLIENEICKLLNDLNSRFPEYKKLVLVGGLFANVKLNQKINDLPWLDELFVFPPMGDDGLSLGAALTVAFKNQERKTKRLDNVFLGLEYSNSYLEWSALEFGAESEPYEPEKIAQKIHDGAIVGWFQGRFEHGPRALGARSIIVKTTDPKTHEILNNRLERHEIMPFAPFVLQERADEIFDIKKSKMTSEFMTMCYDTRPEWIDKIPAVIHSCDGTARPQLVYEERNPKFHAILKAYEKISGLPVLLNTSFNGHGEPIVNEPSQAFKHLKSGMIDLLVAEDYVYYIK